MDEAVVLGFDNQPAHRQAFTDAIATLGRRKDRLMRRQEILAERDEKVLVLGVRRSGPPAPDKRLFHLEKLARPERFERPTLRFVV